MAITPRQPVKQDTRRIVDTQAKGLVASVPKVNKNRDDIEQVTAYSPGHKGQQQKRRKSWPY
jgi:hypothetical protein